MRLKKGQPDRRRKCKVYLSRSRVSLCGAFLRQGDGEWVWFYHGVHWKAEDNDKWEYIND